MNFKKLCLTALLVAGSMVYATVDLRTTIRDVYVRGTSEEAGIITFSVNGDDFANASTSTPVYIRIRLDHGATLAKTLVWQSATDHTANPIFLPIAFEEFVNGDTLVANPETLSIARWRAGESDIWLKVQAPTSGDSFWITDINDAGVAPSNIRRVRWTIGLTARTSFNQNDADEAAGHANLSSATRDVTAGDEASAVSTLVCVNLEDSNLEAAPAPAEQSILTFDIVSFDETTSGVETGAGISLGAQVPTSYSGDRDIARGFDFTCQGEVLTDKNTAFATTELCLIEGAGQNGDDDGLRLLPNSVEVSVGCGAGWGFHRSSRVHVETADGANYGFLAEVDNDGDTIDAFPVDSPGQFVLLTASSLSLDIADSAPYGRASSVFNVGGGNLVTSNAEVQYEGINSDFDGELEISATVVSWYENDPMAVDLDVTIWASNRDSIKDADPLFPGIDGQGLDQEVACEPSLREAFAFTWNFGAFAECVSTDCAEIFFQYLPKVFNTDFWTGVSFVNTGVSDLTSVTGYIYEADGSPWHVEFGPLAMRNQQTWLLVDNTADEARVGFFDTDSDNFVAPVSSSEDLVFGDMRSSMYLVGCVELGALGASGADLDGYLLIGAGDIINGSYSARNTDDGVEMNGDLPMNGAAKKAPTFKKVTRQLVESAPAIRHRY